MLAPTPSDNWTSPWLDALAFAIGLAVAWWAGWNTPDLVWSLWLSSFVVGYATILWMIGQPAVTLGWVAWRDRNNVGATIGQIVKLWLIILVGVGFVLAFFTIHFGGFHYGHSQFLIWFFPADLPGSGRGGEAGVATYVEVVRRYWVFLPAAFLAHRAAFVPRPLSVVGNFSRDQIGRVKDMFVEPYRNVVRMHLLIFFFFGAHFLGLENFAVYAVIYAVYFFPWRLLRRAAPASAPLSISLDS